MTNNEQKIDEYIRLKSNPYANQGSASYLVKYLMLINMNSLSEDYKSKLLKILNQ